MTKPMTFWRLVGASYSDFSTWWNACYQAALEGWTEAQCSRALWIGYWLGIGGMLAIAGLMIGAAHLVKAP